VACIVDHLFDVVAATFADEVSAGRRAAEDRNESRGRHRAKLGRGEPDRLRAGI